MARMDRPEMHPGFWLENLKEEDSFEDRDGGGG